MDNVLKHINEGVLDRGELISSIKMFLESLEQSTISEINNLNLKLNLEQKNLKAIRTLVTQIKNASDAPASITDPYYSKLPMTEKIIHVLGKISYPLNSKKIIELLEINEGTIGCLETKKPIIYTALKNLSEGKKERVIRTGGGDNEYLYILKEKMDKGEINLSDLGKSILDNSIKNKHIDD